jgi:hypothetical protein
MTTMRPRGAPPPPPMILSLTPAMPNWRALFACIDPDGTWEDPIACWALVEVIEGGDAYRSVEGMISSDLIGLERAEAYEDQFVRYLAPSQQASDFAEEVARHQADQRRVRDRATGTPSAAPPTNGRMTTGLVGAPRL